MAGKEVIDLVSGARLGVAQEADLTIDAESGRVISLSLPYRGRVFSRGEVVVPWDGVRKIGADFIIVEYSGPSAGGNV